MSLTGISHYEQHFFLSNLIVRIVVGHNSNNTLNYRIFRFVIAAYVLPLTFHQLYQLYTTDMDFQSIVIRLETMLIIISIICTYGAANLKGETIFYLIGHIKHDYENIWDTNEIYILEKYNKTAKIYGMIFLGIFFGYYISVTTPSILSVFIYIFGLSENMNLTLPFPINNISNKGLVYYSLLFYQMISIISTLILAYITYFMYLIFIQHACTLLSILIFNIRQPFVDNKFIQNDWHSQNNKKESEWILQIIKKYIRITKYIDMINKLSKMIYIIGITVAIVMIIFDILLILQLSEILQNNFNKILECFITVFGSIFVAYINFYLGQVLIDHSIDAFEELCQVPFYYLSKKTQKLLLLITMRFIKPCELSICGLFTASHEIFSELTKRAFSFAMAYYNLIKSN